MSNLFHKISGDDFVWEALMEAVSFRRKKTTPSGINICCPLCIENGERSADRKYRLGLKPMMPGVVYHCFNCDMKGTHKPGDILSKKTQRLLLALGMDDLEVKRLTHKSFRYRALFEANPEAQANLPTSFELSFPARPLPRGAKSLQAWAEAGCSDRDFLDVASYSFSRGDDVSMATTYYWTPEPQARVQDDPRSGTLPFNRRLVIPFYRGDSIVGWSARVIDHGIEPRYHTVSPQDYIFNNHVIGDRERKFVIVQEGVFDALAIDGVATLGAKLNDRQAAWLNSTDKIKIVVPDRDAAGGRLIDVALKWKWHVAFPALISGTDNWWDDFVVEDGERVYVKDVATAVKHYGRLYVLTSILKTMTANPTEIAVKKKLLAPVNKVA